MFFLLPNHLAREGYIRLPTDVIGRATVSKWKHLPVNLLLAIFFQIDNDRKVDYAPWLYTKTVLQPTLFAASLVNKCWSEVAKDVLYKDVLLTSDRTLSNFSSSLRNRERLRPLVRSFYFCRAYSGSGEDWLRFDKRSDLDSIHAMCPNLRSEIMNMQVSFPCRALNGLRGTAHRQLQQRLASLDVSRLTRLEIRPLKNSLPNLFGRHLTFPSLEHLLIRNYESDGTRKKLLEWPIMPRLRSLYFFLCGFRDEYVPLPNASRLRAIEIVGGYFHTYHLWKEIVAIGQSLELLTFAPVYSSSIPYDDELEMLPSLAVLRLCPAYCVDLTTPEQDRSFFSLSPRLAHFVIIDNPCFNSKPPLYTIQDHVMELVNLKKTGKAFLHLESVRINGMPIDYERRRQVKLQEQAADAGIEFLLLDTGLGHYKKLCNLFKLIDP